MKRKNELLLLTLGVLAALPAWAEETSPSPVTANVSLVSNYLFRGISQTAGRPAMQGGFDYMHASGFYMGVWGSNVSILSDKGAASSSSLELDSYVGIKNTIDPDLSYDLGYLRYAFSGSYQVGAVSPDTKEAYAGFIYQMLAVKYSYSLGDAFGLLQARGSNYLDIGLSIPLSDTGFTLGAHYGRQRFKGPAAEASIVAGKNPSYSDYKLSLSRNFGGYVIKAAYSKTNTLKGPGTYYNLLGADLGKTTTVLSINRTF